MAPELETFCPQKYSLVSTATSVSRSECNSSETTTSPPYFCITMTAPAAAVHMQAATMTRREQQSPIVLFCLLVPVCINRTTTLIWWLLQIAQRTTIAFEKKNYFLLSPKTFLCKRGQSPRVFMKFSPSKLKWRRRLHWSNTLCVLQMIKPSFLQFKWAHTALFEKVNIINMQNVHKQTKWTSM